MRLILSQSQQDELERMIEQLDAITELAEQMDGKQRVKEMIGSLSAEAENVLQVTRRLSSTLRRLLDSRASDTSLCAWPKFCPRFAVLPSGGQKTRQTLGLRSYRNWIY